MNYGNRDVYESLAGPFIVPDESHIPKVEGILIAAFPTDNSATPRFKKLVLPSRVGRLIHARG